jgi:acyl-ACP thioesterase
MNNVNYVRTVLGCFSCEELARMDIRSLDLQFLNQCYEGETVSIRRRMTEQGMELAVLNGEGKTAFTAAIQ